MNRYNQFILVKLVPSVEKPGKTDKIPCHYQTRVTASAHDSTNWVPRDIAEQWAAYWNTQPIGNERYCAGFVFTPETKLFFLDIDHALQPDNTWSALSLDLINRFPKAYVEVGQSGTGFHIVGSYTGPEPTHGCKNIPLDLELYTSGRFMALGQQGCNDSSTDHTMSLYQMIAELFEGDASSGYTDAGWRTGPVDGWRGPTDDADLIRRARNSRSARGAFGNAASFDDLWTGNTPVLALAYPAEGRAYDASSADAALAQHLAFWTGNDSERIMRIMQQSALVREKWDRDDYLPRTIGSATSRQVQWCCDAEVVPPGPGRAESANGFTREQLAAMIEATDDFDRLTKEILLLVYQAMLSDSEQLSLLKMIAKKAGVSIKSLKSDAQNFEEVSADRDFMHLLAARAVVQMLGTDNLIHYAGNIWRWSGDGVWRVLEDRDIKQKIHDVAEGSALTANVVNSILDLTKTEVHRPGHRFDVDVARINCISGEIEFDDTRSVWMPTPHVREHFRTTMIPVAYDVNATAPRFEQFLREVFAGDPDAADKIAVVEEALGYSLISSCYLEKFLMLIGSGANGKSVLLAILSALLGPEHVCAVQPSQFDNKFQRGHLFGKLANIITEIAQGAEIADDKLKSLVSGELTTAEHKFKNPFDFVPIATHWFGTNHLPHTRDFSDALFRRAIILTFNNKFEGNKRDVHLIKKLKSELPGILNIALRGLTRLKANGAFTTCASSEATKDEWRLEADQARQFVEDCCVAEANLTCESGALYIQYKFWAQNAGIRKTLNHNNLTKRLKLLGYATKKGTNGDRMILGLRPSVGFCGASV